MASDDQRETEEPDSNFALSDSGWEAILDALSEMRWLLNDDVSSLASGAEVSATSIVCLMPRRCWPRYDAPFARRLEGTAASLLGRLQKARQAGSAWPQETFLNSVAEELLMAEAIRLAVQTRESPEGAEELQELEELSFEDRDFEWLYDLSNDGVTDDEQLSFRLGFANLSFDDWFKPFR